MSALRSLDGDSITITIGGVPVPQGSKSIVRRGGKAWMIDANADKLKLWRGKVANEADIGLTFDAPVCVGYVFVFPRPKRPKFLRHAVKPDIDKLMRAINDGLVDGGLLSDDSRITAVAFAEKRYAEQDEEPHAVVTVTAW